MNTPPEQAIERKSHRAQVIKKRNTQTNKNEYSSCTSDEQEYLKQ